MVGALEQAWTVLKQFTNNQLANMTRQQLRESARELGKPNRFGGIDTVTESGRRAMHPHRDLEAAMFREQLGSFPLAPREGMSRVQQFDQGPLMYPDRRARFVAENPGVHPPVPLNYRQETYAGGVPRTHRPPAGSTQELMDKLFMSQFTPEQIEAGEHLMDDYAPSLEPELTPEQQRALTFGANAPSIMETNRFPYSTGGNLQQAGLGTSFSRR
tara:strand:- start:158 stop:802 length:645 start_codon:yes stop_codon:yes gene_type:complete